MENWQEIIMPNDNNDEVDPAIWDVLVEVLKKLPEAEEEPDDMPPTICIGV